MAALPGFVPGLAMVILAGLTGTAMVAQALEVPSDQLIVTVAAPASVLPPPLTVCVRLHRCVWLASTGRVPPVAPTVSTTSPPAALVTFTVGVVVDPLAQTKAATGVVRSTADQ